MYKNRAGKRAEDAAYEADTDTSRSRKANPLTSVRSATPVSAQHPQHVPLLNTRSYDERPERNGGYGSVSTLHNYNLPSGQHYHQAQSTPPIQQAYGQHTFVQQWHQQSSPLPPPSPAGRNRTSVQQQRSTGPLSKAEHIFDASLYYSDEDDDSDFRSVSGPPISEVSTLSFPPLQESESNRRSESATNKMKGRLNTILKNVPPLGELPPPPPPSAVRAGHRRNNSDFAVNNKRRPLYDSIPSNNQRSHRRTSSGSPLPLHPSQRKSAPPPIGRARSMSASPLGTLVKPKHKRADSLSSVASMTSILSDRSVISDISKSALYKDRTRSGRVRFHSPTDNVHIVMDKDLIRGHLYKVPGGPDEEERFIQYTMQNDDQYTDFLLSDDGGCDCECPACAKCHNKLEQMLYPNRFVLRVNDDIYKRVLSEIADSKHPCGLYFCGHHEDVSRPSIFIAVVIVFLLFGSMLGIIYVTHGS